MLAGANPEAFIDNVIKHGEKSDDEAEIFFNTKIFLAHSDDEEEIEDTISSEGLLIDLDASNYKTNLNSYFSNNILPLN